MKKIIFLFCSILSSVVNAQQAFECGGVEIAPIEQNQVCTYNSTAYISKWRLSSSYVPTANTPIKYVQINFNFWQKNDGTGNWQNTTAHINRLNQIVQWVNNYYTTNVAPSDPIAGVPLNPNIKIQFVPTYSFWQNTTNWGSNSWSTLNNAVFNINPIYHNYMNIHVTGGTFSAAGYSATPSLTNLNYDQFLVTFNNEADPNVDYSWSTHLAHELGHTLDLLHTYDGSQNGIYESLTDPCCPEVCNASNFEYLNDIFQTTNWCGTSCTSCYDQNGWSCDPTLSPPTNRCTNNFMAGTNAAGYFSPNQLGKMHRALSIKSVRRYVLTNCAYTTTENIQITSNETWDFDFKAYSDIVVKNGATLTLTCVLRMPDNAKIIIERGGKLIVDGGIITSGCGGMWQGIIVEGNKILSQYTTGTQGIVEIKNQALIENAKDAIRTIRINTDGTQNYDYTGGIVWASNSTFRNNRRCAEFLPFHNPSLLINRSYFTDCIFEITAQFKDPTVIPSAFISQWDVRGVKIQGNTFTCTTGSGYTGTNRGKGLISIDAVYDVNRNTLGVGNTFTNLDVAIEFGNSSGIASWTNTIKGNTFTDNRHGIYVSGNGIIPFINQNTVTRTTPAVWSPATFGFYSTGATAITVSCNTFTNLTYGNLVLTTGTSSDPVSIINDNQYFSNFRTLQTQNSNSKLKISYNDFTPFGSTQMHWYNLGPIAIQGAKLIPAGNRFLGNPPPNDIWNSSTINPLTYYYNLITDPDTYPNPVINVTRTSTGIAWTPTNWCTSGGGGGLMAGGGSGGSEQSLLLTEDFQEEIQGEQLNGEEAIIEEINQHLLSSGLDTNPAGAIEYLIDLNNEQADWFLLPLHISQGNYETAAGVLATLEADDVNKASKLNYYHTIIDAGLSDRNLSQLDSSEVAELDIIATGNSEVRDNARSILHFFYGREYPIEEVAIEGIPLYYDQPIPEELVIPNIITPNGDGSNDVFEIGNLPENSSLTIYSNSGIQVYHSDSYRNDWPPSTIAAGRYYFSLILSDGTDRNSYFDVVY